MVHRHKNTTRINENYQVITSSESEDCPFKYEV